MSKATEAGYQYVVRHFNSMGCEIAKEYCKDMGQVRYFMIQWLEVMDHLDTFEFEDLSQSEEE